MKNDYIRTEQFVSLLADIRQQIGEGKIAECDEMLRHMLDDAKVQERYIDRTYLENLKERKRRSKIEDIDRILAEMSLEQVSNVHKYTSDEYDEPNHEAEALDAIIRLSRRGKRMD